MRNKRFSLLVIGISTTLLLSILPLLGACAQPEPAPAPTPAPTPAPAPKPEPIVLKAVGFQGATELSTTPFKDFIDIVNERAKGELVIDFLGGPEVVDFREQPMALKNGTFDLGYTPMAQLRGFLAWGKAFELSQLTVMEERKNGAHDFMVDALKEKGFFYLGRGTLAYPNSQSYFFLTKKVTTPQEMAGLQIGPGTLLISLLNNLGAKPIRIRDGEAYTSMERGVEDGHINVPYSAAARQWYEVAPYVINHPLHTSTLVILANLDSWNRLPKHLQDLMIQVKSEREPFWYEELLKWNNDAKELMKENGVEFIEFSPSDKKWWYETATRLALDDYMKIDAENVGKLMQLQTK
ncbi:TRAP transporter substrate-binding protein DctP [Chloroflexota bacterium]